VRLEQAGHEVAELRQRQCDYDELLASAARLESDLADVTSQVHGLGAVKARLKEEEARCAELRVRLARSDKVVQQAEARAEALAERCRTLADDVVRQTALAEAAERIKEHEKNELRLASQRLFLRLKGDGPLKLSAAAADDDDLAGPAGELSLLLCCCCCRRHPCLYAPLLVLCGQGAADGCCKVLQGVARCCKVLQVMAPRVSLTQSLCRRTEPAVPHVRWARRRHQGLAAVVPAQVCQVTPVALRRSGASGSSWR